MKNRPAWNELFHADRMTDVHDEVSSRFSQLLESAWKLVTLKFKEPDRED
jgi:hypothetical protein